MCRADYPAVKAETPGRVDTEENLIVLHLQSAEKPRGAADIPDATPAEMWRKRPHGREVNATVPDLGTIVPDLGTDGKP